MKPERANDGGLPARRAVIRWAWRLFRRQWRAQVLVLALLTLAVAAAVGGAAAAYNLAPVSGNAVFGAASHSLEFADPDPQGLEADVAAAEEWFETTDVIGRRFVSVPGLFDPIEFRAQDPDGPLGSPMLGLIEGRYPARTLEVAVTDGVAGTLDVDIGARFAIDDLTWTVVGVVENPSDLNDDFALVSPSHDDLPQSVTILVGGAQDRAETFQAPSGATATMAGRPGNEDVLAAVGVLAVGTVVLALVSLVTAAGFVVIAQRRLRQLGMLAAIGATEKHIRLVMVSNGAVIGAVAAIIGTTVALLSWFAVVPPLETAVGHRIDRFNVPWWLVGTSMLLSVVTATAAAWWPARAVARIPIVSALSGRPPPPQSTRRSASLSVPLLVVGVVCLTLAGDPLNGWINLLLVAAGIVALILGILSVSPLAIRTLARVSERSSIAVRLALRDLARYQARSGAALAAITLALGIAVGIIITTSAAVYASEAEGNLSDTQLLVRIGEIPPRGDVAPIPDRTQAEVARLDTAVDQIAGSLGQASITPIDVAVAPDLEGFEGLPAVVLTEEVDDGFHRILTFLYLASPDVLEHYEVDLDAVRPETEVLTVESGELWFEPMRPEVVRNSERLTPSYTSLPSSFITPSALNRRGWGSARAAWLIETTTPIDDDQFAEVRGLAASAGITVEARSDQTNLISLRLGATVVGMLVALGIMAMTVGLIRSEAAGDLRTLTATGATSTIRRTLAAATAAGLALLGALLGTGGAYLGFVAHHASELGALSPVPVLHLLMVCVGVPLVAGVAGWLLAGREPTGLARPPIE